MPVEDEEQKEHGHKLGPNIHDISSMFYTQYHALCTHQKQCDISLNFTPKGVFCRGVSDYKILNSITSEKKFSTISHLSYQGFQYGFFV